MFKKILTTATALLFCAGMATAADQIKQKDRTQTPKRDGSCGMIQMDDCRNHDLAALKKRIQKKDGTCDTSLSGDVSGQLMAADQIRTRDPIKDRKRDGSCRS